MRNYTDYQHDQSQLDSDEEYYIKNETYEDMLN